MSKFSYKNFEFRILESKDVNYEDVKVKLGEKFVEEMIELMYTLEVFTEEQLKYIFIKNYEVLESRFEEVLNILETNGMIKRILIISDETIEVLVLSDNSIKYLQDINDIEIEHEEKNEDYFENKKDKILSKLITNDLVIKYFEECSLFHSFEIEPKIEIEYEGEHGYISPNAIINLGEDMNAVHFIVYAIRKGENWENEVSQNVKYLETMYLEYAKTEILTKKPILLCVCEDKKQFMKVYRFFEKTEMPLDYLAFTTDDNLYNKKPKDGIYIVLKDDNDNINIENPKIVELG